MGTAAVFENLLDEIELRGVGAFIKDREGRYLAINDNASAMLNLPSHSVLTRDDFEIFSRRSAELMFRRDHFVMQLDHPLAYESVGRLARQEQPLRFHSIKWGLRNRWNHPVGLLGVSLMEPVHERPQDDLTPILSELIKLDPTVLERHLWRKAGQGLLLR